MTITTTHALTATRIMEAAKIPAYLQEDAEQEMFTIGLETNWDEAEMTTRFSSWLQSETKPAIKAGSWDEIEARLCRKSETDTLDPKWMLDNIESTMEVPSITELAKMAGYTSAEIPALDRVGLNYLRELIQLAAMRQ